MEVWNRYRGERLGRRDSEEEGWEDCARIKARKIRGRRLKMRAREFRREVSGKLGWTRSIMGGEGSAGLVISIYLIYPSFINYV